MFASKVFKINQKIISIKRSKVFKINKKIMSIKRATIFGERGTKVNFINILHANFFVLKCFAQLFFSYILALLFFGAKILTQKVHVKCWPQVSISSTFYAHAAFTRADPESVKFQLSHQYHFMLLGSARVKALRKTLMKLTPSQLLNWLDSDQSTMLLTGQLKNTW